MGIGVLAAFVVMLGAGEAQAQRKREVIVLEMDVADLRAEIMRIARDEAGEGEEVGVHVGHGPDPAARGPVGDRRPARSNLE